MTTRTDSKKRYPATTGRAWYWKDGQDPFLMASADMDRTGGLLVQGDNLKALTFLRSNPSVCGKVQLIYIDPPFGTRQVFTVTNGRTATISRGNGGEVAYLDTLSGKEYLEFLELRLEAMRDLLADTGSIYVHIDCKIGHHVKCLLDDVFGEENFLNDITRIKCNPKNFARKGYGNVKDMILFYRKSDRFVWNDSRQSIEIPPDDKRFRGVDAQGRRYTTTPLHAPGETANGPTGKPWRGLRPPAGRHWRYPPDALEDLDRRGLIEWSSTGNPRKKIYADEVAKNGVKVQDVWTFKDPQNPRYPTEKNLDMLKLIVSNSSRPGDLIMDAFCGSGSTLAAAQELGRRWIGIDASNVAIAASRSRLPGCRFVRLEEGYGAVLA